MKWKNDPYQDLKHAIFEEIREQLSEEHAKILSIAELFNAIDSLINRITKEGK